MKINQVAAQLYTLREFIKTPSEIAQTLKKVREIGYEAVQVSGMGPIEEAELVKILAGEGLTLCATHENGNTILNETEKVVDRLAKLGCKYTAYPYPAGIDFQNSEHVATLIEKLTAAGKVMQAAGQVLTYHNHGIEFLKVDGEPLLETIYRKTDPVAVQGELDTYWVHLGGGDVAEWCEKLQNRLPLLHLKDYAMQPDNKPFFAEIGNGTLNFKKIIAAAEKSGCQWFIVEQDTCPGDPFESLKISFDYIKANLVG